MLNKLRCHKPSIFFVNKLSFISFVFLANLITFVPLIFEFSRE